MSNVTFKQNISGHGYDVSNVAKFGTRFLVGSFSSDIGFCSAVEDVSEPTEEIQSLLSIPGVTEISSSTYPHGSQKCYDIIVHKSDAYTWEEMVPMIEKVLEDRHARLSQKNN